MLFLHSTPRLHPSSAQTHTCTAPCLVRSVTTLAMPEGHVDPTAMQARLRPDTQNTQSSPYVQWTVQSNGTLTYASTPGTQPLKALVNLQNTGPPQFLPVTCPSGSICPMSGTYPIFTPEPVSRDMPVSAMPSCVCCECCGLCQLACGCPISFMLLGKASAEAEQLVDLAVSGQDSRVHLSS